jgi:transcriptional regulator with XRE-family HTH domain
MKKRKATYQRQRRTPRHLAKKLLRIRESFGFTQAEFIEQFGLDVKQQLVSAWEKGIRDPDLLSLYKYSQAANVCSDILLDDQE